jgi:alpha-L-fucosidase 2
MDLAITLEVFKNFQKTCDILEINDELLSEIAERMEKIAPFQVGSKGQLLEWHEELEEDEPGHRHISHLYGMFPGELFEGNKELTEACRTSLHLRLENGGGHTGWSCAWIINEFAVLGDSENAYKYLNTLLTRSSYDNLWDAHPPFQIDGNFGGTAGIANMLVQDRNGEVKVLPAWPKQFKDGYVKGLRIKNGKTIDIAWKDGVLENYKIY